MAQDEMTAERRQELRDVGFKTLETLAERSGDSRVRLDAAIELLNHTSPQPVMRVRYSGGSTQGPA